MVTSITTCPPCQTFADTINGISRDIEDLALQVQIASAQGKGALLAQISTLRQQLPEPVSQLRQCELANNCQPTQAVETVTGTWNATATIWTSNASYPGLCTNFSTTLTFTGNPGSVWNVSNTTFSLSIPEGFITITVTLQMDAMGHPRPITGTFIPLSSTSSPGSMDLSAPLHVDAGVVGSSDVVFATINKQYHYNCRRRTLREASRR